jgi:hypothetical protein
MLKLLVLIALNIKKWFMKHHEFGLKKFNCNFVNNENYLSKKN